MTPVKVDQETAMLLSQMAADAIELRNNNLVRINRIENEIPDLSADRRRMLNEWREFSESRILKYAELAEAIEAL